MVTKKQHFVPQFLLQNFATLIKGSYRTNVYDIKRLQFRTNQNIKDICVSNYTYDTDNEVESFLNKCIETPASLKISKILSNPDSIPCTPDYDVLRFIFVQLYRTHQSYDSLIEFNDNFMKTVFMKMTEINNEDVNSCNNLKLRPTNSRAVLSFIAASAAMNFRLLSDLKVSILINSTELPFIISDHPVFHHNWYLRNHKDIRSSSVAVNGVQIFIPLSEKVMYCLYDSGIYSYNSDKNTNFISILKEDVELLNIYQAINAREILISQKEQFEDYIKTIGVNYKNESQFTYKTFASNPEKIDGGGLKTTHVTWREFFKLNKKPDFYKIKNKIRRRPVICSDRSPSMVAAHEAFNAKLRK